MPKLIKPTEDLFSLFSQEQIHDIIDSIERYSEIPLQYSYFGEGAKLWDAYATRLMTEAADNAINISERLLIANYQYIDGILSQYKKVNVIDITVGNALPVKNLISHLRAMGKMGRYVAIDYSKDMMAIAEDNINAWFNGEVQFEGYVRDVNYDRFKDVILNERSSQDTINLVTYLGGTSFNFRDIDASFKIIHDSLGVNDLLVHNLKLDTPTSRKYFDFNPELAGRRDGSPPPRHKMVLDLMDLMSIDLMNVSQSDYEVEMDYDKRTHQRYIRVRFINDITISIDLDSGNRKVALKKGDTILLVRMWHQSAMDVYNLLERTEFDLLHSSHTPNQEYLLTISRIKRV